MYSFHVIKTRGSDPDFGHDVVIKCTDSRAMTPTNITLHLAAELLAGAAPVIAYEVRESDGVIVFPDTIEGDRLARCLAAQLTLCAAGLWPTT